MCGIAGAISFRNGDFRITEEYISAMNDCISHRGPDGQGVWTSPDGSVGLGHRRLSIIDLSANANQPMTNAQGTIWLVFNGEIYNHADIRKELEKTGRYQWKTDHSDTEVIIHSFSEWGIDCIKKFRGMFAFALWDAVQQELWLVRDRIGIKPLYYSNHHGRLVFASEIKAILKDTEQHRAVNEEAFFHYLSFLTVPAPATLFEGIYKLPAATWMKVSRDGKIEEHRYWDCLDNHKILNGVSEEEIKTRILSELRTSVKLRKVSDVPVGVFLSGGIDSSTNAALFSEGDSSNVNTFTVGYTQDYGSYQNELGYARTVAEQVHAKHHEILLKEKDLIDFMPLMTHLQDEPIADPVCFPVYYVSKLARDNNVIVCQVGEGADELFIGYDTWMKRYHAQLADNLPVPNFFKRAAMQMLRWAGKENSFHYEYLRRGSLDQPVFWSGAEVFTQEEKQKLLSDRLRNKFKGLTSWDSLKHIRERFMAKHSNPNDLDWMSYVDLNFRIPELLLMRVDKMSMGTSLEARVPFLDHKFVELAMSIPYKMKISDGKLKSLLKKAVRGVIPDSIIDRKKQGFAVPVEEWLLTGLGNYVRDEIRYFCDHSDLIKYSEVEKVLESRHSSKIWPIFNAALWWRSNFSEESGIADLKNAVA
ncbi:MAG: asparagine synthase (glutamine-hydrolyzing) [Chitinophagaceae bacterium]|nr:asparagine synthase (glutamine-hydrolyzing) [Chitinophagaceae bacterium]